MIFVWRLRVQNWTADRMLLLLLLHCMTLRSKRTPIAFLTKAQKRATHPRGERTEFSMSTSNPGCFGLYFPLTHFE